MKQGRATRDVSAGTKVEPKSRVIDPEFPGLLGVARGTHSTDQGDLPLKKVPMYEGRGLKAPMVSQKTHKGGSQGSY